MPFHLSRRDYAIMHIADDYFPYPDTQHRQWRTLKNTMLSRNPISISRELYFPNIFVTDLATGATPAIGEVVTENAIGPEIGYKLNRYAQVCSSLSLFVEDGWLNEALWLLSDNGVECTNVYRFTMDAERQIKVSSVALGF